MENLNDLVKLFLVTNQVPGVFCFINEKQKLVWISSTNNIAEALVRNFKLIKNGEHLVKDFSDGWEVKILEKNSQKSRTSFIKYCLEYGKEYRVLNKTVTSFYKGVILPDYRDSSCFLYYIFLMVGKRRIMVVDIFDKVMDGERLVRDLNLGSVVVFPVDKKRMSEYNNLDKVNFNKLMGGE